MAATRFRALLSRLFGRALSEGAKVAARELDRRTGAPPKNRPGPHPGRAPSAPAPAPSTPAAGSRAAGARSAGARSAGSRAAGSRAAGGDSPPVERKSSAYPGDFTGVARLEYAPRDDGRPDPGEVVWAWVPYEEDHAQGKDRPVLVIARDGARVLGLMLTSKDHDRDADQEARHGRSWLDLGSGAWDRSGRPSEVRLDRILRLDPNAVRREGAALDRASYDQVAAEVRRIKGW